MCHLFLYEIVQHNLRSPVVLRGNSNPRWGDVRDFHRYPLRELSAFRSDSVLHPVAVAFIEFSLPLIHTFGIQVCIMADVERSDNAITGSWLSIRGHTLPDQKNLLREALDIIAVFHHRDTSDVTQQGDSGGSCLLTTSFTRLSQHAQIHVHRPC